MQVDRIEVLPAVSPLVPMSDRRQREAIHDLRNLFGVVASATHLLEPRVVRRNDISLLEAIENAALKGGALTTSLLAQPRQSGRCRIDLNQQVRRVAPLLQAAFGTAEGVQLDLCEGALQVRADGDDIDAVLLELVANARTAGAMSVNVRTRRAGARCWLTVADTGRGMSPQQCEIARIGADRWGAHGTGLSRVRRFADAMHGRLHLRSRQGSGTIISISLPMVLRLTVARSSPRAEVAFT